jgi:hypothetical protein
MMLDDPKALPKTLYHAVCRNPMWIYKEEDLLAKIKHWLQAYHKRVDDPGLQDNREALVGWLTVSAPAPACV